MAGTADLDWTALHPLGRPQSIDDADDDVAAYVSGTVEAVRWLKRRTFVGAYVHGSLAAGTYRRAKHDIDLVVVVRSPILPRHRAMLARSLAERSERRPTAGDIDLAIVTRPQASSPRRDMPCELHYDAVLRDALGEVDVDFGGPTRRRDVLLACAQICSVGRVLRGPRVDKVFAPPAPGEVAAVVSNRLDELVSGDIVHHPWAGVLDCCRALRYLATQELCDRDDAARWGIDCFEGAPRAVVIKALDCYRSGRVVAPWEIDDDGHPWDDDELAAFAAAVRAVRDR